ERMAGAIGDPRYDRHGEPIPTAAGEIEEVELVRLSEAAVGQMLELREVATQDPARLRFLAEQGLVPGARLVVTDRQPFNGPTTVLLGGSNQPRVVGQELARLLLCRPGGAGDGDASACASGITRAGVASAAVRAEPRRGLPHRPRRGR